MKKKLALVLSLILLLTLLSACGGGQKDPEAGGPDPVGAENPIEDLIFTISSNWYNYWDPTQRDDLTEAPTRIQDAFIAHNAKVAAENKITINFIFNEWDTGNFYRDILSGQMEISLLDTNAQFMPSLVNAGALTGWEESGIDMSDTDKYDYGEITFLNGMHYGVFPKYRNIREFSCLMEANPKLLRDFGGTSVYELYEQKKWNFDGFRELLQLITDPVKAEGMRPFVYYDAKHFFLVSLLANGGNLCRYDDSLGKYVFGLTDPASVSALEYVKELVDAKMAYETKHYTLPEFLEGNAVLALGDSWQASPEADLICFPYGPGGEYGKTCSSYRDSSQRYFCIPVTADEEDVGYFASVWMEPMEEMSREELLEYSQANLFLNDESYQFFTQMQENAGYNYSTQIPDNYENIFGALKGTLGSARQSVNGVLEKYSDMIIAEIDRNLNAG